MRVHHRLDGADGPLVVLSNSLGTNLGMFDGVAADLARDHRVLRYDQRGHGQSPTDAGPYTLADLGGDVVELLDELVEEKAWFCGVSMGGQTGIWLAAHRPERLHGVVLANTGMKIGTAESWDRRRESVLADGVGAVAEQVASGWVTPEFRVAGQERWEGIVGMLEACDAPSYAAACAAVRDADLTNDAPTITLPTLVITGDADKPTPEAMGAALADAIPGARRINLHAAHVSPLEQPAAFADALRTFIAEEHA